LEEFEALLDHVLRLFPVPECDRQQLARMVADFPVENETGRFRATLFWYHLRSSIEAPPKPDRLCFLVPSALAAPAAWCRFREAKVSMTKADPADEEYPLYLQRADQVLAWRDLIPTKFRFWNAD
jgi:hypothetical protein